MIVELQSDYSVAAFRAALKLIAERKTPKAERQAVMNEQLAINAIRQYLKLGYADYPSLNVRYNNLRLGIALLDANDVFMLRMTDLSFCDGFVVVKRINGGKIDIVGYISSKKARKSFFQDMPTVRLSSVYLTRWLDSRGILGVAGNQETA